MDKLTIERLEKFVNDIKTDGMCDITDHQVALALRQLLAYEQAAKSPAAKIEWDGSEFSVNNVSGEFYYGTTDVYLAPVLPKQPEPENKIAQIKRQKALAWLKRVAYENPCMKEVKTCIEVLSAPAQPVIPERPELRYGDNVLWFLNELAAFDASDIDSDDFDVYGECRNGMEGFATISITELAADAAKLLSAQPVSKPYKLPELNDELIEILGRPNFTCTKLAECLRKCGQEIKRKSEYEQAAVLHVLLNLYIKHGNDWRKHAEEAFTPSPAQESE